MLVRVRGLCTGSLSIYQCTPRLSSVDAMVPVTVASRSAARGSAVDCTFVVVARGSRLYFVAQGMAHLAIELNEKTQTKAIVRSLYCGASNVWSGKPVSLRLTEQRINSATIWSS